MEKIDFVLTWVDGTDPQWLAEKRKWEKAAGLVREDDANGDCRYRPDDDVLRYWFRAVEKFHRGSIMFNDYYVVNTSFDIRKGIWGNCRKWFSIKELGYRRALRSYLCYLVNTTMPVGYYGHIALPHLKSTFQELWDCNTDIMDKTSRQRFRTDNQVNHWLMCAWNQAKGCFYPSDATRRGNAFKISTKNINAVEDAIKRQLYSQVCLNDSSDNDDNEKCIRIICDAFEEILPEKSSFEK